MKALLNINLISKVLLLTFVLSFVTVALENYELLFQQVEELEVKEKRKKSKILSLYFTKIVNTIMKEPFEAMVRPFALQNHLTVEVKDVPTPPPELLT